ncbi:MAG: tetratricopeptide repeat protein [Gammaproteobacteria bacterium]|nr:tetratricopeptide repeat protein [Gammaproteobacteria bacterium]
MIRRRLGFALTILAFCATNALSAPIHAPQAEVIDRLAAAFATHDPARLAVAFHAMGAYGTPAADIVESSINANGYRHLENSEIEAAISVFRLNTRTFPESANAWDSLGEAIMANGDHEMAIRYYRRSLDLDPENSNAARMIERITGEQQLSHASGNKN